MEITQLHEIFLRCGGQVTTDSRTIKGGELFIALKGENFDGNEFAAGALAQGAAYAVVTEGSAAAKSGDSRMLAFPDTLKALQSLASYHREHCLHNGKRIPMLALTGTNGKTTTKELVRTVLSTKYNLLATEGNFNNNIGVPLTLLRMTSDTELAVIEMGASHPGDIKELVDIAHPDFGLITNVGRAHLLGFGSFDGVKRTKGEMYDYILSCGGTCFVNTTSTDLCDMVASCKGLKTVSYGRTEQQMQLLPMDADHPFVRFTFLDNGQSHEVSTHLVGTYNADNVLTAITVGKYFGVSAGQAVKAVESYVPSNNRSQMCKTADNTLIVDAYNANPSSMAAALENFRLTESAKKAIMLGDMLELGRDSVAEHIKVLHTALDCGAEIIVIVGTEFEKAAEEASLKDRCLIFKTSDDAHAYFEAHRLSGFTILVKGSRGTRMERIIPAL